VNRKTLEAEFRSQSISPWKTFLIEAHAHEGPGEFLIEAFGRRFVTETEDASLHELQSAGPRFVVDHADERFWSFHTQGPTGEARSYLKAAVSKRHDLDFVWLPSAHLREIAGSTPPNWVVTDFAGENVLSSDRVQRLSVEVRGGAVERLLDLMVRQPELAHAVSLSKLEVGLTDPSLGTVTEAIDRRALFVAKGESLTYHEFVVRQVVARYRRLVEATEALAMSFDSSGDGGGGKVRGGAIEFRFSQSLQDVSRFVDDLLSSREPFRLWGLVDYATDDHAEIEAVDLHVGQRIRIEVTKESIRLFLRAGGCGNTVARLVSNLQHHVDGGIQAEDPRVQSEIELKVAAIA
jgi:hypothetical protein